jgi:hypothetical protein
MIWNYFSTSHGKGEVNGASALLKREIRKKLIKPNPKKFQFTFDVVNFLKEKATR